MQFWASSLILMASAQLIAAAPTGCTSPANIFKRQGGINGDCLFEDVLCRNCNTSGQDPGTEGVAAGQAPSITAPNNFINFCTGQLITNGLQPRSGSCNPIPMGQIPSFDRMPSTIILEPRHNAVLPAGQPFEVVVQIANFQPGSFTNPQRTYYSAPQQVNNNGVIIGHSHVTVERLGGDENIVNPPEPRQPAFFQGLNDAGNGQGQLRVTVTNVIRPGFYRVCTMNSAANHQPVAMPVANRGAQDDCTKFFLTQEGSRAAVIPEEDLEDDIEAGVITPEGQPIGTEPIEGQDPNAAPPPEAPAAAEPVAPLPELIEPVVGEGAPETPAEEAPAVEQQPELAELTELAVDTTSGFGGPGEFLRISSGVLGGIAPGITQSDDPALPFSIQTANFATALEAVAHSCRLQYRTCRDGGNNIAECAAQRRGCGAEPQDIALLMQSAQRKLAKN